jgi:hypothetical protein
LIGQGHPRGVQVVNSRAASVVGLAGVGRAVIRHPGLWPTALAAMLRLSRPGWWRRWPPVPLPTNEFWRFRMLTAYGGDGSSRPRPEDVVSYLEWCRQARTWRER